MIHKGEVVYVGSSSDVHSRVSRHRNTDKLFSRILVIEYPTRSDASAAEAIYIRKLQPKHNTQNPEPREKLPPWGRVFGQTCVYGTVAVHERH